MTQKNVLYKKRIVTELYFSNNSSCADLSTRTHTSLPLVTKMLNELLEENVIVETGYAPSTGGRRPLQFSLRPDAFYVVAVAMDQQFTRLAIMDMQRRPVTRVKEVELPLANHSGAAQVLADSIDAYVRESGIPKNDIAGIGIGMPGFVDGKKGENFTFLHVFDGPLTDFIAARTGIPTYIENDSSLIALAEFRFGAARNRSSAMVINLGWGIGLGMILNGEIFRGVDGFAGEFSHLPLFSNNKLCSCGKSGCLETEASLLVVVGRAEEGIRNGRVTLLDRYLPAANADRACRAVISAAEKGDKFAVELLSEAGYNIGRGVAILIHLLNPEMIILSGRGSSAGRIWQTPIQQALNEHCIPRLAANVRIEISQLGINAELTGAAALVMENHFRQEQVNGVSAGEKIKAI
ncbi:MAG TPA: ROK family protein [Puia sp.]|jgi:predicted NBD/HSP70 family sugar kinase